MKQNKPTLIPLVEDVKRLNEYLKDKAEELSALLESDSFDGKIYADLCKVLLAQLILFNRKRSGEVERIKTEEFVKCQKDENMDKAILNSLTKFEKQLCNSHYRMEIVGKKNRRVAVLMTETMKKKSDDVTKAQASCFEVSIFHG